MIERKRITIKGVDQDAIDMLEDLRIEERRVLGAIIGDAIRQYWADVFETDEDISEAA